MKKVLIVDDSSYMRMFIKKVIQKGGSYLIIEASNKDEAIEMYNNEEPDIVILDLNMSEETKDGISLLIQIMSIDPEAIAIVISAVRYEDVKDECLSLGAKHYLQKPFETETLLGVLEEYN
ncbi:response regulator [Clostridium chromiireducens]|uniref:Stage 0 sporulation protein A homolog n=1 Tax=Clostridium chromiireducens TaxID=225345 RepID=A0A964RKJ5_9CLOT|nr:response regulator [Clostridium chromiireducens]MVX63311.1 response regulator [Clostridium chromiireducens]